MPYEYSSCSYLFALPFLLSLFHQQVGDDAQPKPFFKRLFGGAETLQPALAKQHSPPHEMLRRKLDNLGNADVLSGQVCMETRAGFALGCTAGDISVARALNINILDDGCTFAGDTVTFTADFEVVTTAKERHDVGIWFSEDGDPNGDKSLTGTCTVVTPAYAPDSEWLDLDGTNDPLPGENKASGDQDTCGDIRKPDYNPLMPTITLTVTCIDLDDNGNLDIPYCTSWRQSGANELCTSPLDAFPGSPSKCKCADLDVNIPVPSCAPSECADQCNDGDCSTGACVQVPKPASTTCSDGMYCTSETGVPGDPDHCDGNGSCVGIAVDCSSLDDQCNDGECNEALDTCEAVAKPDTTTCQDGDDCTSFDGIEGDPDRCLSGLCTGEPVDCSSLDNQCNDGVCNASTGDCEAVAKPDSTTCQDGDDCTSETGAENTPDHCVAGVCTGIDVDCSSLDDQCNDGECIASTGECKAVPKLDTTTCDDGDDCTSFGRGEGDPDRCQSGVCTGDPVDCSSFDNQCNDGVCNASTGVCEADPKPDSTPCQDGDKCTSETGAPQTPDHCDGMGSCVSVPVDCSSLDDQCSDGVCQGSDGACIDVFKSDSTTCDDGNPCTSETGAPNEPDKCVNGVCTGVPVDCSSLDDQCNDGVCNASTGDCEADPKPDTTTCEDDNICTSDSGDPQTPDRCDGAGSCVGTPVDCSPFYTPCREFECDPSTGVCDDLVCVATLNPDPLRK